MAEAGVVFTTKCHKFMAEADILFTNKWHEAMAEAGVLFTTKLPEAMAEAVVLLMRYFTSQGVLFRIFVQNKSIICSF